LQRRLKTLNGSTPHQFIVKAWGDNPNIFLREPDNFNLGLYIYGATYSFFLYIKSQFAPIKANVKLTLGKALGLWLEFKLGSEILKTALVQDMSEIQILGAIVALRVVFSILLHFEMQAESKKIGKEQASENTAKPS